MILLTQLLKKKKRTHNKVSQGDFYRLLNLLSFCSYQTVLIHDAIFYNQHKIPLIIFHHLQVFQRVTIHENHIGIGAFFKYTEFAFAVGAAQPAEGK